MSSDSGMPPLNVLVIDDDEFILDVVSTNFENLGIAPPTTCSDGRIALNEIDNGTDFDVIIVDLNMPKMDGIEVLRNLAIRGFRGGILLLSGEDARWPVHIICMFWALWASRSPKTC